MPKEFEAVYSEHRDVVYRYLYRLCGEKSLAEELTQETFHQALKAYGRFRGDSSIATWLCGIARRLYWHTLRQEPPLPLNENSAVTQDDLAQRLIDSDRLLTAMKSLHALSEPYREVFTLRTFCDMSHRDIGLIFGKTESWARVTYYRARQMLMTAIKEADDE